VLFRSDGYEGSSLLSLQPEMLDLVLKYDADFAPGN
jgi:hypothetical protein